MAVKVAAFALVLEEAVAVTEMNDLCDLKMLHPRLLSQPASSFVEVPARCRPESTRIFSPVIVSIFSNVATNSAISTSEDSRWSGARRKAACHSSTLASGGLAVGPGEIAFTRMPKGAY